MYKKYGLMLLLINLTFLSSWICVKELKLNRIAATQAFRMEFLGVMPEEDKKSFLEVVACVSSGQRVVDYEVLEKEAKYQLSDKDYDSLLRIVEAEAGGEDEDGKLLVANVVLNRVNNERFPDTVTEVVMQKGQGVAQFTPTVDGRFQNVTISEETYEAVERAVYGEDISQGALFFCARHGADSGKLAWFDQKLTKLFTYGNHEFFL
ncbi:MAG: cell wall hydrolase [Blautia sp.]|nr:cell wall hydrolase [Muribaculaceae bacterium]MCM1145772.1 cell wall hydrolase [Lachnoclostridium sp.]MCM1211798.1 cell wall hydrolase [Blautia sp.]